MSETTGGISAIVTLVIFVITHIVTGLGVPIGLIFLCLKLLSIGIVTNWSWWIVLSPLIVIVSLWVLVGIGAVTTFIFFAREG